MDNRSAGLFNDSRVNLRVKDSSEILWKVSKDKKEAKGKVRNISTSGMLLETKTDYVPDNDSILYLESLTQNGQYIPSESRLIWKRKKRFGSNRYQYGMEFVRPPEHVLSNLRQKVQKGIARFTKRRRIETIFNVFLVCIVIALMAYSIWVNTTVTDNLYSSNQNMRSSLGKQTFLTNFFTDRYTETEVELQNTEAHLAKVTTELDTTTEELNQMTQMYNEGQEMLQNVNAELTDTKQLLAQTQTLLAESQATFENDIANLTARNEALMSQMQTMQDRLDYFEGNVSNLREGTELLALYQLKMKLVKSKIKVFKREARALRQAAQVERDRIQMMIGNNGYLVKAGKTVNTDMEKFHAAALDAGTADTLQTQSPQQDVRVNVTIVE
jgi:uncharacterized membrane-anchored protein YhcB (DUF1043 family)